MQHPQETHMTITVQCNNVVETITVSRVGDVLSIASQEHSLGEAFVQANTERHVWQVKSDLCNHDPQYPAEAGEIMHAR